MNRPTDHPTIDPSLDDREFEAYLRRDSQVSQQYRNLQDDEVPAHLDALVLEQARAALEKEPAAAPRDDLAAVRRRRGRLMRWGVPTALAASALLVVSIVIRSGVQHETLLLPQVRQEAPAAAAQPAPVRDKVFATEPARETASPPVAPAPAIVAAGEPAAKELRQPGADIQSAQKRRAAQESSMSAARATRPMAHVDAIAAPPPAMAAALPRVAESIETTSEDSPASAPAKASLAKAAPSPVADSGGELDEIAVTGYRAAGNVRGVGPRDTIRTNTPYSSPEASTTTEAFQAPEPWLEHIRQLRRDGDDRQADREWRRFRKQYPDFVVAADDTARENR
jgi:hypothetical protein